MHTANRTNSFNSESQAESLFTLVSVFPLDTSSITYDSPRVTPRLHLITGRDSPRVEFSSPRERKINCMKLKAHYEVYPAQSHAYHHL